MRNCSITPFSAVPSAMSWNSSAQSMPTPSTGCPPSATEIMRGGPGRRCVVLMNQSSRDDTLPGVRPSPGPDRGAVSHQSSRDKRTKRSLPGSTVRREGSAISEQYVGRQFVGMDLHRRRSVLVRMTESGQQLETVRISNDPEYLQQVMAQGIGKVAARGVAV